MDVARETGKLLLDGLYGDREVYQKDEAFTNLVTEMDRRAEEKIVSALTDAFPDHDYIAEEGSRKESGATHLWLIDPLDGTSNYAHGFPLFAVSLALQRSNEGNANPGGENGKNEETLLGVVHIPRTDESFYAISGNGAYRNDEPIEVSDRAPISETMIATGFPYTRRTSDLPLFRDFENMTRSCRSIRRAGAAAIDLCYLASGIFDGFWEWNLYPWDTAAGCLIVREAGGKTTNFQGDPHSPYGDQTLVSNGLIHREMKKILNTGEPIIPEENNE